MGTFIALCMLGAGVGAIYQGRVLVARARDSVRWPTVTGEVRKSDVVREHRHTGGSHMSTYKALVRYRYRVAGRVYERDTIDAGGTVSWSMRGVADRRIARYPAGAAVEVHYDPRNPGTACLEHGDGGGRMMTGIGGGFAVFGALIALGVVPVG